MTAQELKDVAVEEALAMGFAEWAFRGSRMGFGFLSVKGDKSQCAALERLIARRLPTSNRVTVVPLEEP